MKTGRPKIEEKDQKSVITGVRLKEHERARFEKLAAREGKSLSEWIRDNLASKPRRDTSQLDLNFESPPPRVLKVDEIFERSDADLLRVVKEDRRIERKPAGIHAQQLGEYFCMWANTNEGGLIAVGVANDGDLNGIASSSVEHINELEKAADTFCPEAKFASKRVRFEKGGKIDEILLFRVFYNDKRVVKTNDGKVFVRHGDSKKQLKNGEIRELEMDKGEIAWEQDESKLKYPDDFDLEAISEFADAVIERLRWERSKTREEVLVLRRLGRFKDKEFFPNMACSLLFASDPLREIPGCKVRFLRFDGKEEHTGQKWNAVKDVPIEGTIPHLIIQTAKTVGPQLREFSKLGKDGTFVTAVEYPADAWYEAIVNACCHRSYGQRNTPVFVKMFDDRLEIESPGGFMPFVTPHSIYNCHTPRNPCLMDALSYLNYVKCAAEGTKRMKRTMLAADLPEPMFCQIQVSNTAVKVVLKNNIEQRKVWIDSDAAAVIGQMISASLNPLEKRVINFAAEFRTISVSQAMRLTQKSWPFAKKLLESLTTKGILSRSSPNPQYDRDPAARYALNRPK